MEKIRITAEDIAQTDASPPGQPPYPAAEYSVNVKPAPTRRTLPWLAAGSVVGVITIALILAFSFAGPRELTPRELTLDEWKNAERQQLNTELATSPKLKPYIEDIHPFVTYKSAAVKSIAATTVDGSNRPGNGGSNISEVEFVVTYHWEGPVQKNGYTEVLYVWDNQAKQLKTSRHLDTSALINLDDINWLKLGLEIAPLFFGGG